MVEMTDFFSDTFFMREALKEALRAYDAGEVPVGAVVVCEQKIIARGHNLTERLNDVTAHAEMQAITAAANHLGGKYLNQCTLYVTLEPCIMCAGALYWARLGKLVYGAADDKKGYSLVPVPLLHPKTIVTKGIEEKTVVQMMQVFFSEKRNHL